MKTIEISDEMYGKLVELSKEMNSQDHRITAMPYIFQIQTDEIVYVPDGCGETVWVSIDGDGVLEDAQEEKEAVESYKGWDTDEEKEADRKFKKLSDHEISNALESAGYRTVDRATEHKYQNAFFTAKACKEHIEGNVYRYRNPVDYLSYAFRNPEMELVMQFLCELTGGSLHK